MSRPADGNSDAKVAGKKPTAKAAGKKLVRAAAKAPIESPRPKPKPGNPRPRTIDGIRATYIRRLNNLHVGAQITVKALRLRRDGLAQDAGAHFFTVPSSGGQPKARITRDAVGMRQLLQRLIATEEYAKSLMSAISITEDYLSHMLRLAHRAYPDRLLRGRRNGEAAATVELKELFGRTTHEVLDSVIQQRLSRLMQGSPREYLLYSKEHFGVELEAQVVDRFAEVKATRDVLVHSNGVTDDKYVQKAGRLARAAAGNTVGVDKSYFDEAMVNMKVLISAFSTSLVGSYGQDHRFREIVEGAAPLAGGR